MSNQWDDEFIDKLCDAIVAITDKDEAYRFLEDLTTSYEYEIDALSRRLRFAETMGIILYTQGRNRE